MSDALKPCPFCGGPGYLCQIPSASGGERYIWIAKCSVEEGCGVEFLGTSRKVDAIKEWNTRHDADLATVTAERDRLKRLVESATAFTLSNDHELVYRSGRKQWLILDSSYRTISTHDTVLEAFGAVEGKR